MKCSSLLIIIFLVNNSLNLELECKMIRRKGTTSYVNKCERKKGNFSSLIQKKLVRMNFFEL